MRSKPTFDHQGEVLRMLKFRNIALIFVLALFTVSGVLAQDATEEAVTEGTIAEIAAANPELSTLVELLEAAGLTETLNNTDAQYTVFAPSNEAFASFPQYALDYLSANPELLTSVLNYHVVEGAVLSTDVTESTTAATA